MQEPELKKTRRNLPHWNLEGSIYFITYCSLTTPFSKEERLILLNHLKQGDGKYYTLVAAVIMPDHVHLLLKPLAGVSLSRIMKGIKGVSAHLLNQHRQTTGNSIWQDESWDRIIRDNDELLEKLQYMGDNPLKEELATAIEDYDGWYSNPELL